MNKYLKAQNDADDKVRAAESAVVGTARDLVRANGLDLIKKHERALSELQVALNQHDVARAEYHDACVPRRFRRRMMHVTSPNAFGVYYPVTDRYYIEGALIPLEHDDVEWIDPLPTPTQPNTHNLNIVTFTTD